HPGVDRPERIAPGGRSARTAELGSDVVREIVVDTKSTESIRNAETTWRGNKVPPFARYYVQMSTVMPRFGVRQRTPIPARHLPSVLPEMIVQTLARAKAELAAPFEGLTTDGRVVPGLFPLRSTGVSTAAIVSAAQELMQQL